MTDAHAMTFEDRLLADMRANGGAVTNGPMAGHPLLVMTSQGARTGRPQRAILTWSRDGEAYVVAGTSGGSATDPAWLSNVRANPEVTVEVGNRVVPATASIAEGADRDGLWERHVAALPHFADYPAQSGRVIPMVRLTPRHEG